MLRLGSIAALAGMLVSGLALAADDATPATKFVFAFTDKTGWVIDRRFGIDDLLPPPGGGPGPVSFDKRYPYRPNMPGKQSTYRVADLSNPILKDWLKPSMERANKAVIAGMVPFRARERCWPVGVPGFDAYSWVEPFYFYERAKEIVVINQGGPEIRHIYMNVPHSQHVTPSWYGESIGHFEGGDTLVIDTIGLNDRTFVDNYRTPHTTKLHVIERWKISADKQTIDVSMYVEDPGAFNMPWRAVQRWRRVEEDPILQVPCNENNDDHFSQGLVPLARAEVSDF